MLLQTTSILGSVMDENGQTFCRCLFRNVYKSKSNRFMFTYIEIRTGTMALLDSHQKGQRDK